eukprot:gene16193-biopygen17234
MYCGGGVRTVVPQRGDFGNAGCRSWTGRRAGAGDVCVGARMELTLHLCREECKDATGSTQAEGGQGGRDVKLVTAPPTVEKHTYTNIYKQSGEANIYRYTHMQRRNTDIQTYTEGGQARLSGHPPRASDSHAHLAATRTFCTAASSRLGCGAAAR